MQRTRRLRRMQPADTPDAKLLSAAIDASNLSVNKFAVLIVRDVRSVYRWLKGENDLPRAVRIKCEEILAQRGDQTQ